jgi:hypothetical protein
MSFDAVLLALTPSGPGSAPLMGFRHSGRPSALTSPLTHSGPAMRPAFRRKEGLFRTLAQRRPFTQGPSTSGILAKRGAPFRGLAHPGPFPHSGPTESRSRIRAKRKALLSHSRATQYQTQRPSRIRAAALVQGRIARAELELSVAGPSGRIWAQRRGPVRFWRNKGPFPLTQQRPLPHSGASKCPSAFGRIEMPLRIRAIEMPLPHSGASKCPSAFGRIEMPLPHSGARKHPFGTLRAGISPSVRKASLREAARATTAPDFALSRLGSRSRPRRPSRQPRN